MNSPEAQSKAKLTSMPGLRLDFLMASIINCKASSFEFRDGAKPPHLQLQMNISWI